MKSLNYGKISLDVSGPLARRNTAVHVAYRPVDPLVEQRLNDIFSEIRSTRDTEGSEVSIAVRCIDGFFISARGCNPLREDPRLVRVINYDPVQDISLIVGEEEPDGSASIFWFCFRAFEDTGAVVRIKGTEGNDDRNVSKDERTDAMLDMIRDWRSSPLVSFQGSEIYRSRNITDIRSFLFDRLPMRS